MHIYICIFISTHSHTYTSRYIIWLNPQGTADMHSSLVHREGDQLRDLLGGVPKVTWSARAWLGCHPNLPALIFLSCSLFHPMVEPTGCKKGEDTVRTVWTPQLPVAFASHHADLNHKLALSAVSSKKHKSVNAFTSCEWFYFGLVSKNISFFSLTLSTSSISFSISLVQSVSLRMCSASLICPPNIYAYIKNPSPLTCRESWPRGS